MFKIIILLSGNGSNFQAIYDAIQQNQWPISIQAVISDNPNAFGLQRAQTVNLPTIVIDPKDYIDKASWQEALTATLQFYAADLIILAGFMRILPAALIDKFTNKIINIHPSLLPKYKGLHTHEKVLAAGESNHGCSIHVVTTVLDDGPILAQARCSVSKDDTARTLQQKVHQLEHNLYPQVINDISCGKLPLPT